MRVWNDNGNDNGNGGDGVVWCLCLGSVMGLGYMYGFDGFDGREMEMER